MAFESVQGFAATVRDEILKAFRIVGPMTCEEIETLLDIRTPTATARVNELKKMGLIYDTGQRRTNRSGRQAAVLAAKENDF